MNDTTKLRVRVYPYQKGTGMGNVIWPTHYPMRGGKFPPDHPVGGEPKSALQYGSSNALDTFRARGYWASCFPEGDGIAWEPTAGQSDDQCMTDIRECFGWDAEWGVER